MQRDTRNARAKHIFTAEGRVVLHEAVHCVQSPEVLRELLVPELQVADLRLERALHLSPALRGSRGVR